MLLCSIILACLVDVGSIISYIAILQVALGVPDSQSMSSTDWLNRLDTSHIVGSSWFHIKPAYCGFVL